MFLVVGIAGLAINTTKNRATQWPDVTEINYVVDMSIGNHGRHRDYYVRPAVNAELILNLLFMFFIIIGSIILRGLQNRVINQIDEKNLTPSDF